MADLQLTSNAPAAAGSLHRAAAELGELEEANRRAGAVITAAPAPRVTGLLGESVRADVTANGVTVAGHTAYWTYVHWGAPRIHVVAQPWLADQTRTHEQQIIDVYTDHTAAAVSTAGD